MAIKFILGMVLLVVSISLVSLAWSKFTTFPKPLVLAEIEKNVLLTPVGREVAKVLGTTSSTDQIPINLQQVAASAASTVVETVEKRTTEVITIQAINQLTRQFEKLPEEQKIQIRESICTNPQ